MHSHHIIYKHWRHHDIHFGDFVSGVGEQGTIFNDVQVTTIGDGRLGVWVDSVPLSFLDLNSHERINLHTLTLMRKADVLERIWAGMEPKKSQLKPVHLNPELEYVKNSELSKGGAMFWRDRTYRFSLYRHWGDLPFLASKWIMFIGLNPSTADHHQDDPTIRRVARFAKDWGYDGMYMVNLYNLVSSDPKALVSHDDPIGKKFGDDTIRLYASQSDKIVFAWGSFKEAPSRAKEVREILIQYEAHCLGQNADGSPKHPLYLKKDTKLIPYPKIEA